MKTLQSVGFALILLIAAVAPTSALATESSPIIAKLVALKDDVTSGSIAPSAAAQQLAQLSNEIGQLPDQEASLGLLATANSLHRDIAEMKRELALKETGLCNDDALSECIAAVQGL